MKKVSLKEFSENLNPPIRGSIVILRGERHEEESQSPYKGFNRRMTVEKNKVGIKSQSPYKGFNRTR